jgi:hypothetical protein
MDFSTALRRWTTARGVPIPLGAPDESPMSVAQYFGFRDQPRYSRFRLSDGRSIDCITHAIVDHSPIDEQDLAVPLIRQNRVRAVVFHIVKVEPSRKNQIPGSAPIRGWANDATDCHFCGKREFDGSRPFQTGPTPSGESWRRGTDRVRPRMDADAHGCYLSGPLTRKQKPQVSDSA